MTEVTYQQAGVNLESSQDVKRRIRGIVTPTHARKCWPASEYSARCIRLPMTKTPYWSSAQTRWGTELKLAVMTGRPGWHRRGSGERLRQRSGRVRCEALPVYGLHQHKLPVTRRGDLTRQVYCQGVHRWSSVPLSAARTPRCPVCSRMTISTCPASSTESSSVPRWWIPRR